MVITWASVRCQWKTFRPLAAILSNICSSSDTGSKCRPVSTISPRYGNAGAPETTVEVELMITSPPSRMAARAWSCDAEGGRGGAWYQWPG